MSAAEFRVGNGFDVHPWSSDSSRKLVLGGVVFDDSAGLEGFSDADVIAHACVDALLSPLNLGDIGSLFPDTDERNRGADSLTFLRKAADSLQQFGWKTVNIDCTVVLDRPKIADVKKLIEENLSTVVGAPVTVKGKRSEGVSGLTEGVHCYTTALIRSL